LVKDLVLVDALGVPHPQGDPGQYARDQAERQYKSKHQDDRG
jgi:hypothetical protein